MLPLGSTLDLMTRLHKCNQSMDLEKCGNRSRSRPMNAVSSRRHSPQRTHAHKSLRSSVLYTRCGQTGNRLSSRPVLEQAAKNWPHPERWGGGVSEWQQQNYKQQYLHLWRIFNTVMEQMRCRDPERDDLKHFGQNCRDLGARWCILMPKNRCGALYLHTIMMHGGAFMQHLLPLELTIGMLENSGAERRHQIGKVHFRKSLAGGGKQYLGMASHENRTAFLTMRGVLIWQFGRDLLAREIAKLAQAQPPLKESHRSRGGTGYAGTFCAGIPPPSHSVEGPQHQDRGMDLDERMEEVEREDTAMDLDAELVAEQGDAIDADGGLQVQNGPYIENLEGRGEDYESTGDGSENQDSLMCCSDGGGNSECETAEVDG